jgi:acetyl-CoA carboxylase biotin carboxyl carrier protein
MSAPKTTSEPFDPRLVRKLADILKETDLSEIEVEHGELKIRVARQMSAAPQPQLLAQPQTMTTYLPTAPNLAPAPSQQTPPVAEAKAQKADAIKSPMVGTVYMQPQPGSPSFIKIGDKVKAGQTLLIIEAMKTMNPIPSPKDGVVADILVADGQPVEFGEPLVVFE